MDCELSNRNKRAWKASLFLIDNALMQSSLTIFMNFSMKFWVKLTSVIFRKVVGEFLLLVMVGPLMGVIGIIVIQRGFR